MDVRFSSVVRAPVAEVRAALSHLPGYPSWLGIVLGVVVDGDGWVVELGAKVGPVRQAKRVRMVRDGGAHVERGRVRFVRRELDGGEHSPWVLEAQAAADPSDDRATDLSMRLHYGGRSPLIPLLEPLLRAEAARAPKRLEALLTSAG